MKLKKCWFSYIIWLVFTLMITFLLGRSLYSVVEGNNFIKTSYLATLLPMHVLGYCLVAGCFILTTLFLLLIFHTVTTLLHTKKSKSIPFILQNLDMIMALVVIAGIFVYQLYVMKTTGFILNNETTLNLSMVTETNQGFLLFLSNSTDNSIACYSFIQHLFFVFLGNQPEAVLYTSILLQGIAIVLVYFFVRSTIGKLSAFLFTVFYGLLASQMLTFSDSAPAMICIIIEISIFYICYELLKSINHKLILQNSNEDSEKKAGTITSVIMLVIIGVLAGFGCYFDVIGFVFFVATVGTLILIVNSNSRSFLFLLCTELILVAGSCIGFFGSFFVEQQASGVNFMVLLTEYGKQNFQLFPLQPGILYGDLNFLILTTIGTSFVWIISFFFGKNQRIIPIAILTIGVSALCLVKINNHEYSYFLYIVWLIMQAAAIGSIYQVITESRDLSEEEQSETETTQKEVQKEPELESIEQDDDTLFDNSVFQEKIPETSPVQIEVETVLMQPVGITDQPETKKVIKYIENPLPVPKKHQKKELNFAFEPDAEKLKFDFEIPENQNHFDVE